MIDMSIVHTFWYLSTALRLILQVIHKYLEYYYVMKSVEVKRLKVEWRINKKSLL